MKNDDQNSKSEEWKHPEKLKGVGKNAYDKSYNANAGSQDKPKEK